MCARYVLILDETNSLVRYLLNPTPEEIASYEALGFTVADPWEESSRARSEAETPAFGNRYNVRPTDTMPIITWDESGRRVLELARWGLVPSWWKELKPPRMATFNARADSLADSGMWRGPFRRSRCLVPASGFYEWPEKGGGKPPVFIHRRDRAMFAFAGLADTWTNPVSGERVRSYTIVTVEPNDLMRPVHDRMPAMLEGEAEALWMDPMTVDPETLRAVLQPYPSELMAYERVSARVNSLGSDDAALLEPVEQGGLL
jgi:putative SOS response-associated peptidase YedK